MLQSHQVSRKITRMLKLLVHYILFGDVAVSNSNLSVTLASLTPLDDFQKVCKKKTYAVFRETHRAIAWKIDRKSLERLVMPASKH